MINLLKNHRSVRRYAAREIEKPLLNELLEAATRASTTGNMQLYSIVVTTDSEVKKQLAPCHFNQPSITQAPAVLTFCADFNRFEKWCELRQAVPAYNNFQSFFAAAIDALLAAQNFCIAAESKGLGICYFGTTTYLTQQIIDVLHLPKKVVPITTVTVGYPEGETPRADRLPLAAIIHENTYTDYSEKDINRLYAEKEALPENLRFVAENNKETLAQVFTDIRYNKENNERFSEMFLNAIKGQGF
ncbi:MAG: nitroreductase family protein [Prevotellaceae bacterium]|jgi:nitroreductase|nr:nitroreductase family protein [Prevotellaceae bacterium]